LPRYNVGSALTARLDWSAFQRLSPVGSGALPVGALYVCTEEETCPSRAGAAGRRPGWGDKLAYGRREAARLISVSFNHLRKQIKEGKLKAFKSGGRVLVTRRALDAYLAGESR
jgi:excisionase family DNA binding protein